MITGVGNIIGDVIGKIGLEIKFGEKMNKGSAPQRLGLGETIFTPMFLDGDHLQIDLSNDFTFNGLESGAIRLSDTFKNSKQNTIDGKHANKVLITDGAKKVDFSTVSSTELSYLIYIYYMYIYICMYVYMYVFVTCTHMHACLRYICCTCLCQK